MNKVLYFFSLFSVVFATLFILFYESDIGFEKENSIEEYSYTIRNELEFLNRTLNSFAGAENSLQMKELILLSGIVVKNNVDNISPYCDSAVALKINDFTLKVMEGIGFLSNLDVKPEEAKTLTEKLRNDSRVLSKIVSLASAKFSQKGYSETKKQSDKILNNYRHLVIFFLALCFLMTGIAFYNEKRLKGVAQAIGVEGDITREKIEQSLEDIRDSSEKQSRDMERKLVREQMVGKRKDVLLDAIPAGLFSCDSEGRITLTNSKIKSWFNIDHDVSGEDIMTIFAAMGIESEHREKFTHKGDVFWISEHKSSNEFFYVVTNITEQEEMSRKLLDSERLVSIGEMASRITHEIRNPLSTVKLNSEYMVENIDKMNSPEMLTSLKLIVHEVERLETITEKYMDMVRYRNSEETEKFVSIPVDLVQFSSFHSSEFQKREIDVSLDVQIECELSMTLSSFKEIMLNLYKNAWEELKTGGKVRVSVIPEAEMVVITVEDSGKGVPEEEKKKVFKNFYTNKPGGTGIGLSHSRKLAEEAGGSLDIEDSDLGGVKMVLKISRKS